ncbi:hypothetical protein AB1Y20_013327 [Prymnesium parvum]|uniref:Uncharacterized protein n=1 Tax=Prymnesium parvum TaxID=97485 RepID=A0AB34ILC5_PRYPA
MLALAAAVMAISSPPPSTARLDGCPEDTVVPLSYSAATITHNNLGGQGPDSGAQKMSIVNVAENIDLEVVGDSGYDLGSECSASGFPSGSTEIVKFALRRGSTSVVSYTFINSTTSQPVLLPAFYFSIIDLDEDPANGISQTLLAEGFSAYVLDPQTDLAASCTSGAEPCSAAGVLIRSQVEGGVGNPSDPWALTAAQQRASVLFVFRNTSSFSLRHPHARR